MEKMGKIINKIFPLTGNMSELKFDQEGLWSITLPQEAEYISELIKNDLGKEIHIFDCTAGLGGNTISFAKHFNHVTSIELCESRFKMLEKNVNVYGLENVTLRNDNCLKLLELNCSCYFLDPPWGGPSYKQNTLTKIKLDNMTLGEITGLIKSKNKVPIYFKLPFNYDLTEFENFNYKVTSMTKYIIITIY